MSSDQVADSQNLAPVERGVRLREERNFAEAIRILDAVLAAEPSNPHVLSEAAETARQWGKPDLAVSYYRRLIACGSHQIDHHLLLFSQLKRQGLVSEALAALGQLLGIPNGRTNALAEIHALVREFPQVRDEASALIEHETGKHPDFHFIPVKSHDHGSAKVPLNQVYRVYRTYDEHPGLFRAHETFDRISTGSGQRKDNGVPMPWGRSYDYAVLTSMGIDFKGKRVADLGARDGYFGAWLTGEAAEVYVSDYFHLWDEEWHGKDRPPELDSFGDWKRRWRSMAPNPERLICERQDITQLSYPDAFFDVTICTSVIEHMWPNDIKGMEEIVRVTKPGGVIAMSTEMSQANIWHRGTYWYNEASFLARLIEPHRVEFLGPWDFSLNDPEIGSDWIVQFDEVRSEPAYSAVFALKRL